MRNVLLVLLVIAVISSSAENLKVLAINHGKVWADGKLLQQNSIFKSDAKIRWEDNLQVVKVIGLESHKISVIPAKTLITGKMTTMSELIFQKQRLASRNGIFLNMQDIQAYFSSPIALMNSIAIETDILQDETHFFFLQYEYNGEIINKKLPTKEHCFFLNDEIYKIDDIPFSPITMVTKLCYYEVEEMRVTTVVDNLTIQVEPRKACTTFLQPYLNDNLSNDELAEITEDYCQILFPNCFIEYSDLVLFCKQLHQ